MEIGIFFLALVSPLLYAATNHLDKTLLSSYFQEGGVGTLILFSALLSIMALPILYLIDPAVLTVDPVSVTILFGVGCLNVLLLWFYLQAMFSDEPTVVIIYYQLVPIMGLGLGFLVLGELPTSEQIFAGGVIIVGAIVLTVALDSEGRIEMRRLRTALYMLGAATLWAAETTFFKVVALEENVWRSLFWEHVALVLIGGLLYVTVRRYRESFNAAIELNSRPILGLNFTNEALYMMGNSVAAYVVVLIPVSLTLLMNSFQPLFVLGLGVLLWLILPNTEVEYVNRRNLPQKFIAIGLTVYGGYLLGW